MQRGEPAQGGGVAGAAAARGGEGELGGGEAEEQQGLVGEGPGRRGGWGRKVLPSANGENPHSAKIVNPTHSHPQAHPTLAPRQTHTQTPSQSDPPQRGGVLRRRLVVLPGSAAGVRLGRAVGVGWGVGWWQHNGCLFGVEGDGCWGKN
jgi:hypothetical protein